jgi:hypothetical protein
MTTPTPDFPDFAQPIAQVETDTRILNGLLIASGGLTGQINTAGFNSIALAIENDGDVTGTPRAVAHIIWSIGTVATWQETISFHIGAAYQNNLDTLYFQAPARGSSLNIQVFTDSGDGLKLTLYGSTRQVADRRLSSFQLDPSTLLLDTGTVSVPAGGLSAALFIPPVTKALSIRLGSTTVSPCSVVLFGVRRDGAAVTTARFLELSSDGVNTVTDFSDIQAPLVGMEVQMSNKDTVARNLRVTVWDVS